MATIGSIPAEKNLGSSLIGIDTVWSGIASDITQIKRNTATAITSLCCAASNARSGRFGLMILFGRVGIEIGCSSLPIARNIKNTLLNTLKSEPG